MLRLSIMASDEDRDGAAAAEMTPDEAASAISAIGDSRSWLADRVIAPGWYHLSLGLLAGGAIAEAEMQSGVLFAWSVAGYTVGCGALMWMNQRRAGVAMKYFDACTRAVFAGHVLTLSTLIAIACWLDLDRGTRGAFLAAGVAAVPLTVAFGRRTDKLLRARLQAGQ
jgi:hypothetical protein